jgi:RNA polymerase sigma factor (sigma-70 family)
MEKPGKNMEKTLSTGITGFFRKERSKMVGFIRKRIADESGRDAEDIMQDVMVRLMEGADVGAPIENLASYIYTALKNRIVDMIRSRKPQQSLQELEEHGSLELMDVLEENRSPDKTLESDEYKEEIYSALSQLNDDERNIIIATEFEEITFRELAEDLDVPIGTLLSKKARALDKIKKILTKGGVEHGKR